MRIAEDLRRSVLQAAINGNLTGGRREGWRFVRLGDVGITSTGTTPSTEHREYYNGDIPFIGPADLNFYGTINYDTDKKLTHEGMQKSRCVNAGSILQVCIGTIGKVNVTEKLVCFNQQINAITPTLINSYFLCYVLRSPYWQKLIHDNASQTTLPILNRRKWENLIIPLPPIDEQLRIVSRLNAILPLIAELEAAENELDALERSFPGDMRDALLQAAIEGKLTGGTENWRWVRFGDVISLISGADLPSDQHNAVGNGTPYITGASNIVNGSLIINRWTTTPKKIAKRGDILLTCKGTIGANCILELEEAHIARQVMAIRVIGADTKFVHYYIQHYVDTLKQQAKSMIPGIERKNIIEAPISLPPVNEQRRIVSRLNELLPLCEALEKII